MHASEGNLRRVQSSCTDLPSLKIPPHSSASAIWPGHLLWFFPPEKQCVFYQSLRYSGVATAMFVGHDCFGVKIMKTEKFIPCWSLALSLESSSKPICLGPEPSCSCKTFYFVSVYRFFLLEGGLFFVYSIQVLFEEFIFLVFLLAYRKQFFIY